MFLFGVAAGPETDDAVFAAAEGDGAAVLEDGAAGAVAELDFLAGHGFTRQVAAKDVVEGAVGVLDKEDLAIPDEAGDGEAGGAKDHGVAGFHAVGDVERG